MQSAALFGLPALAARTDAPALPDSSIEKRDPEKYWGRIRREQFLLPEWRAFLNNGSLGVAPRPVVKAVTDYLGSAAALLVPDGEYPRWGYETLDAHRQEMAGFLGCRKDDLAFTHNATEALSTIANGIDLKSGDEVVMTDQEHASGRSGWQLRQARYGITVREVKIPLPPKSSDQLADLMISAIGPRTRVLFLSGITTTTGLVFPVRQICDAARAKGAISVVDGAHMNGQVSLRIDELGCDYYAGSPHKWMFAPAGCGILWGREEMLERLWPAVVTGAWNDRTKKAARFQYVGTNNRAIFEGMIAGVRFLKSLGPERVYTRMHHLARLMREKAEAGGLADLLTPNDDRLYGSLVSLQLKGVDLKKLAALCAKRRIWTLAGQRLRLSAHIHTRPQDIDLFFETLKEAKT